MELPEMSAEVDYDRPLPSANVAGLVGLSSDDGVAIALMLEILGWRVETTASLADTASLNLKLVFVKQSHLPCDAVISRLLRGSNCRLAIVGNKAGECQAMPADRIHVLELPLDLVALEAVIQTNA